MDNLENKPHPFERTIGPGPYRFVDFFVIIKPSESCPMGNYHMLPQDVSGGTCAHCGMGIMNNYVITRGDGKKFAVGSDCIAKVGLPVKELTAMEKAKKAHEKKLRDARKLKRQQAQKAKDDAYIEKFVATWNNPDFKPRESWARQPHPNAVLAARGKTLADYVDWNVTMKNARALARFMVYVEDYLENGTWSKGGKVASV